MATLSPSGSNRTRLSAAASFHYRRPRRRPDTRHGLSIHTLTTPRRSFGAANAATVPRSAEDRTRRRHSQSTTYPAPTPRYVPGPLCGVPNPAFRFVFPQHSESDTGGRTAVRTRRLGSRSLTSFRPFVSSSRASGLGVSRDRRGTGGARAADNMTVAAPWPRGP